MMWIWLAYNALLPPLILLSAPIYLPRMWRRGGLCYEWGERIGRPRQVVAQRLAAMHRPVWIHAVSVGEVRLAAVLIRELRLLDPARDIVVSTTTITGRRLAESLRDDHLEVVFHTLDLWEPVCRMLDRIRPSLVVLIEQELWPNLMWACRRRSIPVWLVNARLSDRSRRRMARWSGMLRPIFNLLDLVVLSDEEDLERFRECGFPSHAFFVAGNMKFDVAEGAGEPSSLPEDLIAWLGWDSADSVLLAGSTHDPEEAWLLDVFEQLEPRRGALRVVLVPRHAERAPEVARMASARGRKVVLRSGLGKEKATDHPDTLVVDSTGELGHLYRMATMVLVGKSFLGVGGQNFLEAASQARPVVCGPEMSNFRDLVALFESKGALARAADAERLRQVLQDWLDNPSAAREVGERAARLVEANRGAGRHLARMVNDYLNASEPTAQ